LTHSDGVCANDGAEFRCGCAAGYVWTASTGTCDVYTCPATALAPGATRTAVDLCTGTELYNAGGSGTSCTGYSTTANELLYSVSVPAGQQVDVTMTGTGFDAALWVTTSCEDLVGAFCVAGADEGPASAETVTIINPGAAAATYYIVADSYSGCGSFNLAVSAATAAPRCGDSLLSAVLVETCDDGDTTAGDGCSDTCHVEFGWTCDNTTLPSVCTAVPSLGTFAAAAAIPPQTGGPLASGDSAFYMVTFTTAVLLDGTVVADAGDPDIAIYDISGTAMASHTATTSTETWTDDSLPAGTYMIEIYAYTAFTTFTMTLSTTAP
jgi:cysteine-rich repeat protein